MAANVSGTGRRTTQGPDQVARSARAGSASKASCENLAHATTVNTPYRSVSLRLGCRAGTHRHHLDRQRI